MRERSPTKPGTLLKHQIPVRTFAEWDQTQPGFVEIDLVAHDGGRDLHFGNDLAAIARPGRERGRRYPAESGISLNGLVAVALREYLDARTRESHTAPQPRAQALGQAVARQVRPDQCGGAGELK